MKLHPLQVHIVDTFIKYKERLAVGYSQKSQEKKFSFGNVYIGAIKLAALLKDLEVERVAITSDKNELPSIAILAILLCGKSFVPINPSWPAERVLQLLQTLEIDVIISSQEESYGRRLVNPLNLGGDEEILPEIMPVSGDDILYIVPTSGTTSSSKLIQITYGNVWSYLNNFSKVSNLNHEDIIGHISELNFDVAIGDILWSFFFGAMLLPLRSEQLLEAPMLAEKWGMTVWSSAPSVAKNIVAFYEKRGLCVKNVKKSFFIGEKLHRSLALQWANIFVGGEVFNVYGPAEATVSVSIKRFDAKQVEDVVSIGHFYDDQEVLMYDDVLKVSSVAEGELLLSGTQVMKGYLNSELNRRAFLFQNNKWWYRTGDWVCKKGIEYFLLRRIDNQFKIGGQRFELEEVEERLKEIYQGLFVYVVPHYYDELGSPTALVAVIDKQISSEMKKFLQQELRKSIPGIFVPKDFISITELPLNSSGKIDRSKLLELVRSAIG